MRIINKGRDNGGVAQGRVAQRSPQGSMQQGRPSQQLPPQQRRFHPKHPPMSLPFDPQKRKGDWIDWAYRHRTGVLVSIVCYFTLAICFVACEFTMNPQVSTVIEVQIKSDVLEKIEELEQKRQELERIKTPEGRVYNEIADNNSKSDRTLRRPETAAQRELYQDVQRLQNDLASGSREYEESLRKIDEDAKKLYEEQRSNTQAEVGDRDVDRMARGNVVAIFDLEGRTAAYLHIPAYQCRGGGVVVVDISVNRNGKVVAARTDATISTSDRCLEQEAENAARRSRFNVSSSAPNPQKGTITYTFVAQ